MYKIYINENPILLCSSSHLDRLESKDKWEIFPYMGNAKVLLNYVDLLEKANQKRNIVLHSSDYLGLKVDFKRLFNKISASGGIVEDNNGKILFIYRRGFWDLPKGKREKGEKKRTCALREVEEETGLMGIEVGKKIGKSRHTYRDPESGERVLKITHWYRMKAGPDKTLQLQAEEDIEDAKWLYADEFIEEKYPTFASIESLLGTYLEKVSQLK
ncbi:NUDIX domain-containing protein [Membranihabitans maritimus]|uniref:NUDIX domain-containing protein n=1 Tax=Membranihabitans maritimus TaxID=2904244 RepID=UPI001F3CF678|nr:NUDIX domain-containing protein [Membranihabitans maritimus]